MYCEYCDNKHVYLYDYLDTLAPTASKNSQTSIGPDLYSPSTRNILYE